MCGVFGIRSEERDVSRLSYFGLFALQHRGQESAGIAVSDRGRLTVLRDMGLVAQVFNEQQLQALPGEVAIGHTRYSTTGANRWANAQPLVHHGALRMTDLATVLDLDASTVSRHVRTLEDRGLVDRTTDPADGRATRLAVTDEGRERLEAGAARRRALVADMLQDWSPEDRETLRRLLTRLADDVMEHRR